MKIRLLLPYLFLALFVAANLSAGLLDGTSWQIQAVPTVSTQAKSAQRFDDVLTFADGKLTSKKLQASGIGPVAYSADGTKNFLNWKTSPFLRKKNKAEWGGVIKGTNITGNLKWVIRDGREFFFSINGKRK